MRIFIVSSVLHYLFAKIIIEKYSANNSKIFYLQWDKNLETSFENINNFFTKKTNLFSFSDEHIIKLFKREEVELIISNRFDSRQAHIAKKGREYGAKISMLEEGASIYLSAPHFNFSPTLNEIKFYLGLFKYAFPVRYFDRVYTLNIFNIPGLGKKAEVIDLKEDFLGMNISSKYNDCNFILSQWLLKYDYIDIEELIETYKSLKLENKSTYYKPHPWDRPEHTNRIVKECNFKLVDDDNLPVELHLLSAKNITLYGFWTTSMFYIDYFTENKVVSILKKLSIKNKKLETLYKRVKGLIKKSTIIEILS